MPRYSFEPPQPDYPAASLAHFASAALTGPDHAITALGHASLATTGRYLHARPSDSSARYLGV